MTSPIPSQLRSKAARPDSSTEASIGWSISSSIAPSTLSLTSALRFLHRLVPVAGLVGALADPAESDHFGELILAQVLEHRPKLFLDAVVDVVVEDAERAFLLVVDIVGGLSPGS